MLESGRSCSLSLLRTLCWIITCHYRRILDSIRNLDSETHLEAVDFSTLQLLQVYSDLLRPLHHIRLAKNTRLSFNLLAHLVLLSFVDLLDLVLPNRLKPVHCPFISDQETTSTIFNPRYLLEEVRAVLLDDEDVEAGHLLAKLIEPAETFAKVRHFLLAEPLVLLCLGEAIHVDLQVEVVAIFQEKVRCSNRLQLVVTR